MLTGIATWLLKGWLSRWAVTAEGEIKDGWRWLTASPVHLLLALCAILACYGAWEHRGRIRAQDRAEQCQQASVAAKKAQDALRAKERADYQEKASHAQEVHTARVPAVRAANDAYAVTHRVRKDDLTTPVAVSSATPAGVRAEVPSLGLVAVSDADLQACSAATEYAVTLREWAVSVSQ